MCQLPSRTREIGLRMSIGARGIDILVQFLIEAVIISVTGGVIGVIVGALASWLVNVVAHWWFQSKFYSVVLFVCRMLPLRESSSDGIRQSYKP